MLLITSLSRRVCWRTTLLAVSAILCLALVDRAAIAGGLDLSTYRGKVVYVDFWASWCTPCRKSFPWLSDIAQQYRTRNFVVIAVNVDHEHQLAQQFLDSTPANFPVIYDPHGDIAASYKIVGMPSAVLIDRSGRVRFRHDGFSLKKRDEYEAHVQTLLAEPTL
jgi:thiol-disulfide isomerase/thioredoxin